MTSNTRQDTRHRGNYVLLSADTLHLLLPQHEVGAVEYLDGTLGPAEERGLLKLQGKDSQRRFAALSAGMTLLPNCPPERFLVTPLGAGEDGLAWCWNELQILIDVELPIQPLPEALLTPDTPVTHYVEFQGKLAYLCSAQQLFAYALQPRAV